MNIELLTEKNFTPNSLDFYNRTQIVKRVYRRQNGEYALVDMPYIEDWTLERKRLEAQFLRSSECIAYLALENGTVAGFIGLKKKLYGSYMILDMMHVSADYRGKGIGRQLFARRKEEARKAGAEVLYISACSSEETIAFYKTMGAEITENPIREFADDEPYDLQMICSVV